MRGQQRRELAEHGELRGGCDGTRPDGRAEFAQEQHLRGLAGVISQLPAPGAFGVAAAAGLLHGGAQRVRVDGAAGFEMGQQEAGGAEQRRGCIRGGGCLMRRRNGRGDGRDCSDGSHGRMSRRAGTGETGGWLSLTPLRLTFSRLPSSSQAASRLAPSAAMTARTRPASAGMSSSSDSGAK